MKKIVLCGGGTAGHVYPALAVAEKLKGYDIHFFGGSGMEKEILKNFPNITYHEIPVVKLERKLTLKNLLIPIKLIKGISATKKELQKVAPDVIFSKGGFVSVPVATAGKKLNIPVISHESDLSFGLANKIILHNCNCMCTTFEETAKHNKKCVHTGQPIRDKIFHGQKLRLGFNPALPTLLILGGSLGAKFLNEIIFDNLDKLTQKFNIIHICGKKNFASMCPSSAQNCHVEQGRKATAVETSTDHIKNKDENPSKKHNLDCRSFDYAQDDSADMPSKNLNNQNGTHLATNYFLVPYAENIEDYYATADIVISRAGSGVINELLALQKPMLLIPLSKKCSRGDQIENAKLFAKKGYAEMLEEEECDFIHLMQNLEKLQKNREKIVKNMQKTAKNNAVEEIVNLIKKYAKE